MALLSPGLIRTPRGVLPWRPCAFVAKAFQVMTAHADDRYVCLGVIGNWAHLSAYNPGDHTMYSQHDMWVGGKHYVPKRGWAYAFDARVPEPEKFEKWFLGRLRAGFYPGVKYWNILNRHWARNVVRGGKPFAKSSYSGDEHLHVSGMPTYEYAAFDILGDYEHWRTTGRNVGDKPPTEKATKPSVIDAAARKLPIIKQGRKGALVALAQAALVARELLPDTAESIDGVYGPATATAIAKQQKAAGLPVNGKVVDTATWDKLFPETSPTIVLGDEGYYARLMQALLQARGFYPGSLDGEFGPRSVAALKRFQVAMRIKNSVLRGRGDGIGGDATWIALLKA